MAVLLAVVLTGCGLEEGELPPDHDTMVETGATQTVAQPGDRTLPGGRTSSPGCVERCQTVIEHCLAACSGAGCECSCKKELAHCYDGCGVPTRGSKCGG